MASQPLVIAVPGDAIGDAQSINDSARPPADKPLHLTFAVTSASANNIAAYVATLTDPKSPNYHKWLTEAQFGEKFGANPSDISTVTSYLKSSNFTGVTVWPNKLFVSAYATRAQAEKAFGVTIHGYNRSAAKVRQGYSATYYGPDSSPKLDARVASVVSGLFGLSNMAQRKPSLVKPAAHPNLESPDGYLYPSDLSAIYNEAALHNDGYYGAGITIGLFSPTTYAESDVDTFFAAINVTKPNINIISVNGGATDATDADEACLDIETIIGQAPAVTLNVYEGPNDGSFDIFSRMLADKPDIVSMSYGTPETDAGITAAYAQSYDVIRANMAAEGISIFVSSGDTGAYSDDAPTVVAVSIDASSPYVTSVGGTELTNITATTDYWNGEIAWTYNDGTLGSPGGSGGGLSIYYSIPSWQYGVGVQQTASDGYRQVPDVAACASTPYYYIYTGGAYVPYGGTSASCPLWASSFALIEDQVGAYLGCLNPTLYTVAASSPTVYHDITSGNNGVYNCNAGWDFVTGWGSCDFNQMMEAISGNLPISTPISNSAYLWNPGEQMISTPYDYSSTTYTTGDLFTGLETAAGKSSSAIAAWEPLLNDYVVTPTAPANVPVPGQAYWARFASTGGGLSYAGATEGALSYSVSLVPGWNMVADPYNSNIAISNSGLEVTSGSTNVPYTTAVQQGMIGPEFYDYDGAEYIQHTTGDVLKPFDGYWLYSTVNTQLTFLGPQN